jgi:hypothetical protein
MAVWRRISSLQWRYDALYNQISWLSRRFQIRCHTTDIDGNSRWQFSVRGPNYAGVVEQLRYLAATEGTSYGILVLYE